jgi:hypothetical protein
MNLSLKELNELIYCVGVVIADDHNGYGHEERTALFNKLYENLEKRVQALESLEERIKYIKDNTVPASSNVNLSYRGRTY